MPTNSKTPPVEIHFNVDQALESVKTYPPFNISLAGEVIAFQDPRNKSWQALESMETASGIMRTLLSPADYRHFSSQMVPPEVLNQILDAMLLHFEISTDDETFNAISRRARG